jgi:3-phosphoshikimate 1-carboxyvinyltransferase
MKTIIHPGHPIDGSLPQKNNLNLPGDKSLSHRAALFAALATGESRISNFQVSGVTRPLLNALKQLDVDWQLKGTNLMVTGCGLQGMQSDGKAINCGNSATTLRLLAGALSATGIPAVLDGSDGLRRRPMDRIVLPLQRMGVPIQASENGGAPLTLTGRDKNLPLRNIQYTLPVASAQVKSCLLLAALAADGTSTLFEPGPSRDHTENMLSNMGVEVTNRKLKDETKTIYATRLTSPSSPLKPLSFTIPGDISAAAFLIVAALITPGSKLTLTHVGLNNTRTGLLDALQAMGADLRVKVMTHEGGEPAGKITVRHSALKAIDVNGPLVVRMIDEFPIFAVAASFANGTTTVRDAYELRLKESDRITAICQELSRIGVDIQETPDGFIIKGGTTPKGGEVESHGDHRLAMSLAVAGLACHNPVAVHGAEMTAESFPDFIPVLRSLGSNIQTEQ